MEKAAVAPHNALLTLFNV